MNSRDKGAFHAFRHPSHALDLLGLPIKVFIIMNLEAQLKVLNPQEKRALADWLWQSAESAPDLSPMQMDILNSRAEAALADVSNRYPLGDAEKQLRR